MAKTAIKLMAVAGSMVTLMVATRPALTYEPEAEIVMPVRKYACESDVTEYEKVVEVRKIKPEQKKKYYRIPEEYRKAGGCLSRKTLDAISRDCKKKGVPVTLVLAIIECESGYKADTVGCCGDTGYMQIIPRYQQSRMESLGVKNLLDPESNVRVGIDYLSELMKSYPEQEAVMFYNMGYKACKYWKQGIRYTEYSKRIYKAKERIDKELEDGMFETD